MLVACGDKPTFGRAARQRCAQSASLAAWLARSASSFPMRWPMSSRWRACARDSSQAVASSCNRASTRWACRSASRPGMSGRPQPCARPASGAISAASRSCACWASWRSSSCRAWRSSRLSSAGRQPPMSRGLSGETPSGLQRADHSCASVSSSAVRSARCASRRASAASSLVRSLVCAAKLATRPASRAAASASRSALSPARSKRVTLAARAAPPETATAQAAKTLHIQSFMSFSLVA